MAIKKKKITVNGYEYAGEEYDYDSFRKKASDDLYGCFKAYIERVCNLLDYDTGNATIDFLLNDEGDEEFRHAIVGAIAGAVCNDGNDGEWAYDLEIIKELSEELCEFYY